MASIGLATVSYVIVSSGCESNVVGNLMGSQSEDAAEDSPQSEAGGPPLEFDGNSFPPPVEASADGGDGSDAGDATVDASDATVDAGDASADAPSDSPADG